MLSKTLCFNRSFNKKAEETFNMIKPITDAQSRWLVESVAYATYHPVRKTAYCMICGHKWKPDKMSKTLVCPSCNKKLSKFVDTAKKLYSTGGFLSVVNGMQVERSFMVVLLAEKYGYPGCVYYFEYKRLIMDNKGNMAMFSLSTKPFSYSCEDFIENGKMLRRKKNMGYKQMSILANNPYCYYKHKSYLPEIIRNGYEYKKIPRASRMATMQALLSNPHAETLLKAGYDDMLCRINFDRFWPSVRIAIRNNYKPKDYRYWEDVLVMMERLNMDMRNPKYVCPSSLVDFHDSLMRKINDKNEANRKREQRERMLKCYKKMEQKEAEAEAFLKKKTTPFVDWEIKDDNIVIKPLLSVDDFKNEGLFMNHCVYTSEYHMKVGNLTATAIVNGMRMETIDYDLDDHLQAYGCYNKHTEYHDEIIKTFNKNKNEIVKLLRESVNLINQKTEYEHI